MRRSHLPFLQASCLDAKVELAGLSSQHEETLKEVSWEEKCCYRRQSGSSSEMVGNSSRFGLFSAGRRQESKLAENTF